MLIVVAGMLTGSQVRYVVTAIAAVLWLFAKYVTVRGLIDPIVLNEPIGTISAAGIVVLALVFAAILSQLATKDLQRALDDATFDLVQANRQLDEANKLKSQFMARTSHELRTPLSSITVFTDLALRKIYGPLTPQQEDSLQRVLGSAKRLTALISDILDLSKIEAGEIDIVEEHVTIASLVEVIRTSCEDKAREKGIVFEIECAPTMPQIVLGDETRLTQVLINLADNAIKFTEKGSVAIVIEPTNDARWRLVVKDTGRGIQEEHFDVIFSEFRQLDDTESTTKAQGTGLGLAITKNLVQLMDGTIHVRSEIGKGSTFEVILPLNEPAVA